MLISILLATFVISAIAFVTAAGLSLFPKFLHVAVPYLGALAAGTMLSAGFLHLLPESLEFFAPQTAFSLVLASFVGFFLLERILHWHHCHEDRPHEHTFGLMSLLGDSVHNFLDGLVIAAAFTTDWRLGIITTLAIVVHEFPQELGDFGVLIMAGYSRQQALLANFGIALTAMAGGLVGYFLGGMSETVSFALLPIAAGGFFYIATVDLLPELRKHTKSVVTSGIFVCFVAGLLLIPLVEKVVPEPHEAEAAQQK